MSLVKEDLAKIFSFRKKFGDFSDRFGTNSSKRLLNRLLEGIEKTFVYRQILWIKSKRHLVRKKVLSEKAHFAKLKLRKLALLRQKKFYITELYSFFLRQRIANEFLAFFGLCIFLVLRVEVTFQSDGIVSKWRFLLAEKEGPLCRSVRYSFQSDPLLKISHFYRSDR